jgi:hypothetical protein
MKDKKIKFDEESSLYYKEWKEAIDTQGVKHKFKGPWIKAESDLNLGSAVKPNADIAEWRYFSPQKNSIFSFFQ